MAITKKEVFISSNFDEFPDLRRELRDLINSNRIFSMQAIDLNENRAIGRPPLVNSIDAVKRSEVMVLLVGEQYGGIPSGEHLSYCHLEYRAALESDCGSVILPYFFGSEPDGMRRGASDPRLSTWQREILDNHTVAFYQTASVDWPAVAQLIFQDVQKAQYDLLTGTDQMEVDAADDTDKEFGALDLASLTVEELAYLERRSGVDPSNLGEEKLRSKIDLATMPARAAALEQRAEALRALKLGERKLAVEHLRRALQQRPLDMEVNYWLSRLLVSTGRRKECKEAVQLALRSANLATHEEPPRDVRAAAAYIVASQAEAKIRNLESALRYAEAANQIAPWFAAPYIQLACVYALQDDLDAAFKSAGEAFNRHPVSILKLNREPLFQRVSPQFREFKQDLRGKLQAKLRAILDAELQILSSLSLDPDAEVRKSEVGSVMARLGSMTIMDLVHQGRSSGKNCLRWLQGELVEIRTMREQDAKRDTMRRADLLALEDQWTQEHPLPEVDPKEAKPYYIVLTTIVLSIVGLFVGIGFGKAMLFVVLSLLGIANDIRRILQRKGKKRLAEEERNSLLARHKSKVEAERRDRQQEIENEKAEHRRRISVFEDNVRLFETTVVRWNMFSPSVGNKGAKQGDIIRVSVLEPERADKPVTDSQLLPPDLLGSALMPWFAKTPKAEVSSSRETSEVPSAAAEPQYQLFRILSATRDKVAAARWAVYQSKD
ncbi:MAG: DUF4062 domain-containing protein [Candidatus Eisenbacteria bacterium]|nr:DUF4062 domain-containing protein [Candidatus Eisenbacteria bacterium]